MFSRLERPAPSILLLLSAWLILPVLALFAALPGRLEAQGAFPATFTDLAGRPVTVDEAPGRIIVAQYIANYLMVGGAKSLELVVGMTFDGWRDTRLGEYTVFTEAFPILK